ncbi:threonine ammonia-lyase [Flexibacterium corallicola]|uniref:threonine ammonia-lyase n=1 Tax=Flexibacterium corallicola TaxID=3037259 RepID=UPI00286F6DE5|nr:threonine/serine dehydratase [Pseudovibrio sp. M1P-2-3]
MSHSLARTRAPGFKQIKAAAKRIESHAVKTPLLSFPVLNDRVGGTVLIKPESLQRTGSFKFRGAFNRLLQIPEQQRAKGVIACSSGNHAQGVAAAAKLLGINAKIIMPSDAPAIKVQRTKSFGAQVILYDRAGADRDALLLDLREETGATLVHPYEDPEVIAGQGTVGLEIAQQAEAMGYKPDAVIVCTGGGGLSSGIAIAFKELLPACEFYTCEPVGFDDVARSVLAQKRVSNAHLSGSICDAVLTPTPGEIAFSVLRSQVTKGLVVSDDEALAAIAFAFNELKLVVEPGGAVALAAILAGRLDLNGRTVALTISGGNVEGSVMARALENFS